MTNFHDQNYQNIILYFVYNTIISNTDFMKRIIPLHFRRLRIRKIFSKAIYFFANSSLVWFGYFSKSLRSSFFNLNPVCQSSSSFFSSDQGIGSPASFLVFQASSISILSSNSCKSFSSCIETKAAIGSPRRVRTNDSSPKATRLIIFENFFLASAVVILFSILKSFYTLLLSTICTYCNYYIRNCQIRILHINKATYNNPMYRIQKAEL